jgi:outer membrane protein
MSRHLVRALLALSCLSVTAFAQEPMPGRRTAPAEQPFTLQDAIALALQKNFELQIQANNVSNAKDAVAIQEGAFSPTITANITRDLNQAASVTNPTLEGTQSTGPRNDSTTMRVGVSERVVPTNATVSVTTNVTRRATNNTRELINPAFGNGVSAQINQPILRDFGRKAATAQLERAKLGLGIAAIAYKSRILTLIQQTENQYYTLVAARETQRIRQNTLQYNQKLFEENQARRATGVATDLDVLSAEVGVANARRGVIQAEQSVRDAEDNLLNLINVPNFDVRIGPVAFDDYRDGAPSFGEAYKRAREYYPDTLSATETIKQLELDLDTARRNTLPDLDLIARLGYTAKATDAGYQQAIANLPNDHGNNWSVGLSYSLPWGRHADRARYRTAQTQLNSQKLRLEQLEQSLLVNVRQSVRAVETQLAAVEIAAKAVELAARQYDQQKARFDAGLSTSRLVLLAQDDLESARFQELSARVQLRRAVAELSRLEGTSLERFGVQLPQ